MSDLYHTGGMNQPGWKVTSDLQELAALVLQRAVRDVLDWHRGRGGWCGAGKPGRDPVGKVEAWRAVRAALAWLWLSRPGAMGERTTVEEWCGAFFADSEHVALRVRKIIGESKVQKLEHLGERFLRYREGVRINGGQTNGKAKGGGKKTKQGKAKRKAGRPKGSRDKRPRARRVDGSGTAASSGSGDCLDPAVARSASGDNFGPSIPA